VIPASWNGFSAQRVYRGVTYHITVKRAGSGNAVALKVDGKAVAGNLVPLPLAGQKDVKVEVTLQ